MATNKRVHKSTDVVVGGVCGGIAEYFAIDPTFVRIIAVALMVASFGTFLIFYIAAMVIMPKDSGDDSAYIRDCSSPGNCASTDAASSSFSSSGTPCSPSSATPSVVSSATSSQTPSSANTSFDSSAPSAFSSSTDEPSSNTHFADSSVSDTNSNTNAATSTDNSGFGIPSGLRRRWGSAACIGALFIAVGVVALLANLVNISFWRFWPLVLIVVGLVQLFTPNKDGWSLERAGGAIVLVSFGILFIALMFGIVTIRSLFATLAVLWPVFLVVAGLAIIAAARKQEAFSLVGSLVLSATLLVGVWLFGGVSECTRIQLANGETLVIEFPQSPYQYTEYDLPYEANIFVDNVTRSFEPFSAERLRQPIEQAIEQAMP